MNTNTKEKNMDEIMNEVHKRKYIYSIKFANAIIQKGIRCVETGFNAKTSSVYWAFYRDDLKPFYDELNQLKETESK